MSEFKRILVPVDLDAGSRQALTYALTIAEAEAEVDVLHVWEPPKLVRPDLMVYLESDGRMLSLAEFTQNQARAELQKLLSQVAPERPKTRALLVVGSAAARIVETAEEGDYDLVIMRTHARKGLPRVMLGSVAEKVVRLANCPVLIVPPHLREETAAA